MQLKKIIHKEFNKQQINSRICRLHESTLSHHEIYAATKTLIQGKITMGSTVRKFEQLMQKNMVLSMLLWLTQVLLQIY